MNKAEFLSELRSRLSGLPATDLEATLAFYTEMIDDRIEDGMSEQDAVRALGALDDIAKQVISTIPMGKLARERVKQRSTLRTWEIVLLSVGSPVWVSLLLAAVIVFLALYVVLWTLVAVVWIVGAAFAVAAVAGIATAIPAVAQGSVAAALFFLGAGLALAGLSIFTYFGARAATRGTLRLSKAVWNGTKRTLVRKEKTV